MKVVAVAESGRRIVGSHHGVYSRVKIGDKSVLTQQGTDLAVDKDFRGKGLYTKMQAVKDQLAIQAGATLGYGLSTNPIVVGKLQERNLPFPSPVQYMVNIRDIELHFKNTDSPDKIKKKYGYLSISELNSMRHMFKPKIRSNSEFEISEIGIFDEEIDSFWRGGEEGLSFHN